MQENDPNFPLYDPRFQLYHAFYQDHLAEPAGGVGQGPVIGHAVSSDQVHWAHLPVAVWNDQPYDNVAIYTGSSTLVNGVPTMVYPGLCVQKNWPACNTGTVFAIATPVNLSDPLLTAWQKPSYNPLVENVQRDPSTAWRTSTGEWRFTNYEGKVYFSEDFVSWNVASNGVPLWPEAECPDFFPLPPFCQGNGCSNVSGTLPTHVHKQSSGGQDWYSLGVYTEGASGTTGNWTETFAGGLQPLDYSALLGLGTKFYASKSFYDPVALRQIYYGWALVPPASTQTLARVTEYHAGLQRLVFNPLPELAALRAMPPLYSQSSVTVAAGNTLWLGDWAGSVGNQSEVGFSYTLPAVAGSITVGVLVGQKTGGSSNVSTPITISYDPVTFTANVSAGGSDYNLTWYMPGVDLPGGDYNVSDDGLMCSSFTVARLTEHAPFLQVTNVNYTDPKVCQAVCQADPNCKAYTYVTRPPLVGSCCLKGSVPAPNPNPTCTSGAKPGAIQGNSVALPLLPGDTAVDVRVFVDNTFLEVFVMGGRVALTLPINSGAEAGAAGVTLTAAAGADADLTRVNVWHMNGIWVSPESVLAAAAAKRDSTTGIAV